MILLSTLFMMVQAVPVDAPAPRPTPPVAATTGGTAQEQRPVRVPMGDLSGIRTVSVTLAGINSNFLFDTGGGVTTIDPDFVEPARCRPWAQLTGHRMTGETITSQRCDDLAFIMGGRRFVAPSAGIFDLSVYLPPNAPTIGGLIALDVLEDQPFTLDLKAGLMILETPASLAERAQSGIEVPIRLQREAGGASLGVYVPVRTEQGTLWMLLDSGSDASLQVAPSAAAPLGLSAQERGQSATIEIVGVSDVIVETSPVRIREIQIDGNIGAPVMSRWIMTFDIAREKLWITRQE